jgi:glutathione S-transferase
VTLRLHYIPGSSAMVAHAALAETGAAYELARVERDAEGGSPAACLELNPWGLVPTLEDGGLVVTESVAIVLHLADTHPAAGLAPALGTPERTQLYRWLAYFTSTVQPSFMRWFYPERFTAEPAGVDAVRLRAAETLRDHLDWLERELSGRPWLVDGPERTGADLFGHMLVRWGRFQEPAAWDRPHLRDHTRRLLARRGVRRMWDEQGLDVPELG